MPPVDPMPPEDRVLRRTELERNLPKGFLTNPGRPNLPSHTLPLPIPPATARDFGTRSDYEHFLGELVRQRNLTRTQRFEADRAALRPLPAAPFDFTRELSVRVSRFSLVRVLNNHYSVPSRLIGATLKARIRSERLDLYHGAAHLLTLPRLTGRNQRRIDYRHLIWSLVRKPGAFAAYCYRDELFPTTTFRRAYDALLAATPTKAEHTNDTTTIPKPPCPRQFPAPYNKLGVPTHINNASRSPVFCQWCASVES